MMLKRKKLKNKKLLFLVLLIVFSLFFFFETASAQEYQTILTWHANSFYPSDYEGKPAAVYDSQVSVALMILKDGEIIDISNNEVFWYFDNKFIKKGVGLDNLDFYIKRFKGEEYLVRVKLFLGDEQINGIVTIPVAEREVVIKNPRPSSNLVSLGEIINLEAIPYFLTVESFNDLGFFWKVDNVLNKNSKDNFFTVAIGNSKYLKGTNVMITSYITNLDNSIDSANSNLILKIR